MQVNTYISTDWIELGGIGFHTFVKMMMTDQHEVYLISVSDIDGEKETGFWKIKGSSTSKTRMICWLKLEA